MNGNGSIIKGIVQAGAIGLTLYAMFIIANKLDSVTIMGEKIDAQTVVLREIRDVLRDNDIVIFNERGLTVHD